MKTDTVRFGLYGCNPYRTGSLMAAATACCAGKVSIAACYDVDRAKVDAMAGMYQAKACYDLLSFQKADFNVAFVALPPFLHPDAFAACAQAGKAIYLEKPVCVDDAGEERLIAAMMREKPACYVGLSAQYIAPHRKALEIRRRADCGGFIACHHRRFGASTGQMPAALNWRHKLEQSGGELNQHCCHDMHYLRLLAGDPESVMAMTCTLPSFQPAHEEEDLTACIRFKQGMAVFGLSQRAHRRHLTGHIHMENLAIQYDWATHSRVRVYKDRPRAAEETYEWDHSLGTPAAEDLNVLQMADFLDAFRNGRPMPITLSDGIQAYRMIRAIRESYRTRREISIPMPVVF